MKHRIFEALVVAGLLFGSAAAFSAAPEAVSPGSTTGTSVGDGCPTFSWGQVPSAEGYELLVYSVEEEKEGLPPVLNQRISGAASSWTPSLDRCMERGGRYAWSIRALGTKEPAEWSAPLLFDVALRASQAEFEKALTLVQHYLAGNAEMSDEAIEIRVSESPSSTSAGSFDQEPVAPASSFETAFSVDGNVEAMSFTGDGSTLTGITTAAESWAHATNSAAHHSRYSDAEAISAAGPHTVDTDTTCDGQACNGANFTGVDAATLGGLSPAAFSQGPHIVLPDTSKGDLLVRTADSLVRLPKGKDGQVLVTKSSAPAGVAWSDIVTDYYCDFFTEPGTYWGTDGTMEWDVNAWEENDDDSGGVYGGSFQVVEEESCSAGNCLRVAGHTVDTHIVRKADLEMPYCLSAELSFMVNNQLGSDTVRLEASSNGGQTYSMLKDYDNTNIGVYADAFDLTEFISDQTQIRLRVLTTGGQFIYFDNVMISCSALGSG